MRAITVVPGQAGSAAVTDVPEPEPVAGELLVEGVALGVCGTDREIARGEYGWAPPGEERLILGHESLGRVLRAPSDGGFRAGDLVVGVVRRPDPVPCAACARGEFDLCRNGRYTERGIKGLHGYGSQRWTVEAGYAVRLDPALEDVGVLMEPASVVAKAWERIDLVRAAMPFDPGRLLVTGAGPIGLLAALLGVQRGLEVHVLDRVTGGPKPQLVAGLGAAYHVGGLDAVAGEVQPDVIVEATGAAAVVFDAMRATASCGILCLTGVSPAGREVSVDAGAINREIVLENDVVLGSVNANMRHYAQAAQALERADAEWLRGLITRRVALDDALAALEARDDDVKVLVALA